MQIINQSYGILSPSAACGCGGNGCELPNAGFIREAKLIEQAGRTACKSEDRISGNSYDPFIRNIIKRKHEAVIEFGTMMVKFITDRGVSHELVRHRLCSFLQESTRYCGYGTDKFGNEITVIRPVTWDIWQQWQREEWEGAMREAEVRYLNLVRQSAKPLSPQQARAVLPNSLKTEICVRANFREWRQIFRLRCDSAAHPDMRSLITPLRDECIERLPCVFADLREENND